MEHQWLPHGILLPSEDGIFVFLWLKVSLVIQVYPVVFIISRYEDTEGANMRHDVDIPLCSFLIFWGFMVEWRHKVKDFSISSKCIKKKKRTPSGSITFIHSARHLYFTKGLQYIHTVTVSFLHLPFWIFGPNRKHDIMLTHFQRRHNGVWHSKMF